MTPFWVHHGVSSTVIELATSPYFFVLGICLAYMNMFARFDENPAMTLQDIKETKRYRRTHTWTDGLDARTDGRMDGQLENSTPTINKVCGGIMMLHIPTNKSKHTCHIVLLC